MGQFSWFTQDTNKRIVNGRKFKVIMTDDKGNQYREGCYDGYGVFGGKDYYVLLAEMNGYNLNDFEGSVEQQLDQLRCKGIKLAFDGHPAGDNPNVLHPSLTESGKYMGGVAPESDPYQGFIDLYNDDEWDDDDDPLDYLYVITCTEQRDGRAMSCWDVGTYTSFEAAHDRMVSEVGKWVDDNGMRDIVEENFAMPYFSDDDEWSAYDDDGLLGVIFKIHKIIG